MNKGKVSAPQPNVTGKFFRAADYVRNGLSEEEVLQLKSSFDLFDTDQGGSVDTKELKAAMVSLGFDSKNALIFRMINKLDEDGSGQIEFGEWLDLMTYRISPAATRSEIQKIFPLYDEDGNGLISIQNLQHVVQELGLTGDVQQSELQEMLARADLDKDGYVNINEFYTILTRPIKE